MLTLQMKEIIKKLEVKFDKAMQKKTKEIHQLVDTYKKLAINAKTNNSKHVKGSKQMDQNSKAVIQLQHQTHLHDRPNM